MPPTDSEPGLAPGVVTVPKKTDAPIRAFEFFAFRCILTGPRGWLKRWILAVLARDQSDSEAMGSSESESGVLPAQYFQVIWLGERDGRPRGSLAGLAGQGRTGAADLRPAPRAPGPAKSAPAVPRRPGPALARVCEGWRTEDEGREAASEGPEVPGGGQKGRRPGARVGAHCTGY